jgi:uncharacterized protein YoxC
MRIFSLAISGIALIGVLFIGITTWRVKRDLRETQSQISELRQRIAEETTEKPAFVRTATRVSPKVPPPRLNQVTPTQIPTQEVNKAEIQQVVSAQLAEERQQERQRREEAREERARKRREQIASRLGLTPAEEQKFEGIVTSMQQGMRSLRETLRDGQKTFAELRPEMDALAERTRKSLEELLGSDRLEKLKELEPGPPSPPGAPQPTGSGPSNRWLFGLVGGGPPPRGVPLPP